MIENNYYLPSYNYAEENNYQFFACQILDFVACCVDIIITSTVDLESTEYEKNNTATG